MEGHRTPRHRFQGSPTKGVESTHPHIGETVASRLRGEEVAPEPHRDPPREYRGHPVSGGEVPRETGHHRG